MKRFLLHIFFTFTCNLLPVDNNPQEKSWYTHYVIIKEMCKFYVHSFFFDEIKLKKSVIACSVCNNQIESLYVWGYCAGACHEQIIGQLLPIMHYGSQDELSHFLVCACTEIKMPCTYCDTFCGWYVPSTN